jgi:phosphoribosylanthranilate isomerase
MQRKFPDPDKSRPQVKICGLTRLEDALACVDAGVDAIGVNFWPQSRRYHPLEAAVRWLADLPPEICRVAVLVNAGEEEIRRIWQSGCIDVLQFHGGEPDEAILRHQQRGIPVIRATAVRTLEDVSALGASRLSDLLLDAWQPGEWGGTGRTCDWPLAREAVLRFPDKRIILSGGLNPDNVADAVAQVRPFAVDVASGVESAPGIKDAARIRAFVRQARGADVR